MHNEDHRQYHEIASIFPLMQGEEFEALKQDIAENGLLEPIWLHPDGSIIDGRNRHRACMELDIQPEFRTWNGNGSLVSFVVSLNLHRRHLNPGQRGIISLKVKDLLAKEIAAEANQKRSKTQLDNWRGPENDNGVLIEFDQDSIEESNGRDSLKEAASVMGVSKNTSIRSQAVMRNAPELADKVMSGDMTLHSAYREVQHRQKEDPTPPPDGEYRVFYADPPWRYSNDLTTEYDGGSGNKYGVPDDHYPTMATGDICAMGEQIKQISAKNAVLFLWSTSPHLPEALEVAKAWGFTYKSSFVWDKVRHNFAHYNSMRHEFLLICVRGSCTPDIKEKIPSVQRIERTSRHSEKPDEFRAIIDKMYTHGNRIELFARQPSAGWQVWGNEVHE